MSDYVNYEAVQELSDEELNRSILEDSMPSELFHAMLAEQSRRRLTSYDPEKATA